MKNSHKRRYTIKNVIIGIDGGSYNFIDPLIKKDVLPNFKKILNKGFYANLKVTNPPVTVPSWPCNFSGLKVEDLGKCMFYNPKYGLFNSKYWRDYSIFSIEELRHFCLNIPSSYPAWPINGEIITGMLSPSINENMIYPKNLLKLIKENWIIDGENIKEIFDAFEIKKEVFLKKTQEDFDLLTYVIRMPDCITHHPYIRSKKTQKVIDLSYKRIDSFLGNLIIDEGISTIFIISDHGLKKYNHELNMRKHLETNKILSYNTDEFSKFLSVFIKIFGIINIGFLNLDTTFFHNKVKEIFRKFFRNQNSNEKFKKAKTDTSFIHFYSNYGGIVLGKKDRKKREIIKEKLSSLKYVDKIYEFNDDSMPDFIIKLYERYLFSVKSSYFKTNRSNSFNHSDKGIYMAFGDNIKKGNYNTISYIDIAPTILKLYDIKAPPHMKGKILDIIEK
ncbi:MAG: hypothetical protein EU549_04450 [Promethearchaeota archaeon]|nr:MAG: hypothetical protein EU549_04450 [Candidatus Lokiarchaeota archaeon]